MMRVLGASEGLSSKSLLLAFTTGDKNPLGWSAKLVSGKREPRSPTTSNLATDSMTIPETTQSPVAAHPKATTQALTWPATHFHD